jgi:type IV pilus assembly protein PilA
MCSGLKNSIGYTLAELMVVVTVVAIVLAIAVPYYMAYRRTACDRTAAADISRLGASFERFQNELLDRYCDLEVGISALDITWFLGPYYGWGGTNDKCMVLVRRGPDVFNHQAWACAMKGSHPSADPEIRYIYRVVLLGGKDLPIAKGTCSGSEWRSYGGPGTTCYTSSMLHGSGCVPAEPMGKVDCSEIMADI